MKKFALSILSVFVILGGLLFSACEKQVSLSIGEGQEMVELYTNNDDAGDGKSKTIDVTLQNSKAGVKVEILKGEDVVSVSSTHPARKGNGEYSFDISCFDKSGDAEVKVYAIDDIRAYKNIFVKVNTDLESITAKGNNSNLGSDLFVVKGVNKNLMPEDYFDLAPTTANKKDIDWTFETTQTNELKVDGLVVATIEDGVFVWNEDNMDELEATSVVLRATFSGNKNVSSVVQLDVLQMASIDSLKVGGTDYITAGTARVGSGDIELKRNDNARSKIDGTILIKNQSGNFVEINPIVYKKVGSRDVLVEFEEWSKYFVFNITNYDSTSGTYAFEIDVTDTGLFEKVFGEFDFFFEVRYQRYNFAVSTMGFVICSGQEIVKSDIATTLHLDIGYTASSVELRGAQNQSLNNTIISAFSSYNNSFGFAVKTIVEPSDVAIDSDKFLISIDINQMAFLPLVSHLSEITDNPSKIGTIYCGGRELQFELETNSATHLPERIVAFKGKDDNGKRIYLSSGDTIYLRAGDYDISELQIDFVSVTNSNAKAAVYANLYKITNELNLSAKILLYSPQINQYVLDSLPVEVTMSSSRTADSEIGVVLFVEELGSINGLSVGHDDTEKFSCSELVRIDNPTGLSQYDNGVWALFRIRLVARNFAEEIDFWLEHVTGKKSGAVKAIAYVPLSNVSLMSQETSSVSIYAAETFKQDYEVLPEGVTATAIENETLSKFVVEAGSNISILLDTEGATLDADGVQYGFLSKEALKTQLTAMLGDNDKKGDAYILLNKLVGNGGTKEDFASEFNGLPDDEKTAKIEEACEKIFENFSKDLLDLIAKKFDFSEEFGEYFKITENSLRVEDNQFSGIVMVKVNGFGQMHKKMSRSRYFVLESIYAVKYLKPNIETKMLYTTETLSIADINLSFVDVSVSFRPDDKKPTYSNDLSLFGFVSAQFGKTENGDKWAVSDGGTYLKNDYYTISGINFSQGGRYLNFRITANSTKFLTSFRDTISITYKDGFSDQKRTEVSITIKNMQRIEEVDWLNQTGDDEFSDGEIYLNLTSPNESEKSFVVSTAVGPSNANNIGLKAIYIPQYGTRDYLSITTSSSGQTFNLNINTVYGGLGYLYLVPEDMIKRVDGVEKILVYKYSTDENGAEIETPDFIDLDQIPSKYNKFLNGSSYEEFKNGINDSENIYSNFFLNNEGKPVLYEDILLKIKVVIADGRQRETAFRIYSTEELKTIQYANNYYEIMNDLSFNGWQSLKLTDFKSTIFGHNENIVLSFKDSECLVDTVGLGGEISDLAFVGDISMGARAITGKTEAAGFVARENKGTISNVRIDVYYDGTDYKYSELKSTCSASENYVGGIVGINSGLIENCFSYGLSIGLNDGVAGGIAGQNNGNVYGCGVEFYKFTEEGATPSTVLNGIGKANPLGNPVGVVGGIVGSAQTNSLIEKSYVYAYSLEDGSAYSQILQGNSVGAFVGSAHSGSKISESFAFVGNLSVAFTTGTSDDVIFKNSYLTYDNSGTKYAYLFVNGTFKYGSSYEANSGAIWTSAPISTQQDGIDFLDANAEENIWEIENINPKTNFGLVHLKNVSQSSSISVNNLVINDECDRFKRVDDDKAVLFVYKTVENVADQAQRAKLDEKNEISLLELFKSTELSEDTVRSLLITSVSDDILISSGKIKILNKTLSTFDLNVHSKMDFTQSKTFEFVIVNNLPDFEVLLAGRKIRDGETVLLQKGTTKNIVANLTNSVSLNGQIYTTVKDEYDINIVGKDNYVGITKSNNSLIFEGKESHSSGNLTQVGLNVNILGASEYFATALQGVRTANFNVSVFSGATSLLIDDASELSISPREYAPFGVTLLTDNGSDNLVFGLSYQGVEIVADREQGSGTNEVGFVVDNVLTVDIFWSKTTVAGGFKFDVVAKVDEKTRHLIEKNYADLVLSVNALSQKDNDVYKKNLNMSVKTQEIDGISLTPYSISNRQSRNSVLYYTVGNDILTTVVPGSDQIFVVTVDPTFAKMTHFTLTYSVQSSGVAGTVSISKLSKSVLFGYYVDSANTTSIANGIRVDLTEDDKTGDGVFYFRAYVSTAFKSDSKLTFTLSFYDGETLLDKGTGTRTLDVTYLQSATVLVNGVSTYALSKGSSATVVVKAGKDQKLTSINLVNNYSGIVLSKVSEETVGNFNVFTYSLFASVNAQLLGAGGDPTDSGIFYVSATVERIVNGKLEIKSAKATVYLVDFSIDGDNISVYSSVAKKTFNGKTYDVFYAYINSTSTLSFNYPIIPEEYNYDKNDVSESNAVAELVAKQNEFKRQNYYKDANIGYYINCEYNEDNGVYKETTLKEQLWYAESEDVSTRIYNKNYEEFLPGSGFFAISKGGSDEAETLQITGKRSGIQLMKLRTNVWYQGTEFVYDYYFLIVVEIYSDEETPTQIESGEKFVEYLTQSEDPDDYILMNDIVLNDYTPISTDLVNSFDGNGYTIHINSFAQQSGDVNLALFDTVTENTTLKNITVNVYQGGQIFANVAVAKEINVAGFALENNGVIYNCQVVAYRDSDYQSYIIDGDVGIVVKYQNGANTEPIELSGTLMDALGVTSNVSGFVIKNNASIANSRVGGTDFRHIIEESNVLYVKTEPLGIFTIEGQGVVSGFAISNESEANIAASFVKNVQINNVLKSALSQTAGFAIENKNQIQTSYVEANVEQNAAALQVRKKGSSIYSMGYIAGFVYSNEKLVKNSYSNIAIENTKTKGSYVAGFVYQNLPDAIVSQCYSACDIEKYDVNQMQFSGVDEMGASLNQGKIEQSYFYNDSISESTLQSRTTSGAFAVNKVELVESFYGFSFAAGEDTYDGIWRITENGPTLVGANEIALSNRYAVTSSANITTIFYNRSILDIETYTLVDLSYGSAYNPIIIRTAYDFAVATGKATSKEISSYKEYYDNENIFGNYRIVNNIDFSEIDQNAQSTNAISLRTTSKTFKGLLDGNGFEISNISLNGNIGNSASQDMIESFGLFAKLDGAVVMGIKLGAKTIVNDRARIVGTLAGVAINSRVLAISLSIQENEEGDDNISVQGNNVVGGIVGMLLGDSLLGGIDVESIKIYSSYNQGSSVNIETNQKVGGNVRHAVKVKSLIGDSVKDVSYGGAVVGYVDIYGTNELDFAKYSSEANVEDYNVISVSVEGTVDVYAEVAGGMFGYVGQSTKLYNISEKLAAPSHIISKHLYAGGIVGENYGGLFAISASYTNQDAIEGTENLNENTYYTNANSGVERGQDNIFSYAPSDSDYEDRDNDPLFVGGLVGFMGSGYIYVGYNKLNVCVKEAEKHTRTKAVGGIIGLLAKTENVYQYVLNGQQINIQTFISDVYASGDVYNCVSNGIASGLIGALSFDAASVLLKNAMAVNYYSYTQNGLTGDTGSYSNNVYTSDKHFMLIGNLYKDNTLQGESVSFSSNLYVVSSENEITNIKEAYEAYRTGNATVGGYDKVLIANTNTVNLEPFGFKTCLDDKNPTTSPNVNEQKTYLESGNLILKAKAMGSSDLSLKSRQFATMYTYFLSNGWDAAFWQHDMGDLLPHIRLEPKERIVFWDVYNTGNILEGLKNRTYEYSTIILRGKVSKDDSNAEYSDIDLRVASTMMNNFEDDDSHLDVSYKSLGFDFKGTLISYYEYFANDEVANVTKPIADGTKLLGGKEGSRVGIVLGENSLFSSLGVGTTINGINFYFNEESDTCGSFVDASSTVEGVLFKNISLTYNDAVTVSGQGGNVGLISNAASSSSFVGVKIIERAGATITLDAGDITGSSKINMGLLVGNLDQNSPSRPVSISGISFGCERVDGEIDENAKFIVNYTAASTDNVELNAGLIAGSVTRSGAGLNTKIDIKVVNVKNDIQFDLIDGSKTFSEDVYVGGYFGQICSVNSFEISSLESSTKDNSKNILISERFLATKNLYSGLIIGKSESEIKVLPGSKGFVKGAIYQTSQTALPTEAYIGGLVGQTSGQILINGDLTIDFSVANTDTVDKTKLEANLYDYSPDDYSPDLKPLKAKSVYAGGLVGQTAATISATNEISLSGYVEIQATDGSAYFGGLVGQAEGNVSAYNARISSDMSVSVQVDGNTKTAYVGSLVGSVEKDSGESSNKIEFNTSNSNRIEQISVISAKNIYAGAFGYIGLTEIVQISGLTVGGAIKIWSDKIEGGKAYVGGIVGSFDQGSSTPSDNVISNCSTFGDVMVMYPYYDDTKPENQKFLNYKFSEYAFGGIVGSASSYGGLRVNDCKSIMTNFNYKLTQTASKEYNNAGAIVGKNSDHVSYSGNQYSSGACLCYQEEAENTDVPYANGEMKDFSGYTNNGKTDTNGILSGALTTNSTIDKEGSKLNPISLTSGAIPSGESTTNGLAWVTITSDLALTNVLADNLNNLVLVGNGNKVSVTRTDGIDTDYAGGLVNSMGETSNPTFNVISGVVLDANIELDFNTTGYTYFGGFAGQTFGNSIIYASLVAGEISIGGSNSVNLSGFVGHMDYGMISECYSDAHLTYRADNSGILSGIAYLDNGNTLIKSTYSAGLLETYLDNNIYTFAYSNKNENRPTTNDVFECYSISQIKRNSTTGSGNDYFLNKDNGAISAINIVDKAYNANYNINLTPAGTLLNATKGAFALGYGDTEKKQNAISADKGTLTDANWKTISSWYFNPKINYGYASHNFGWLKNVTIYTRDTSKTITNSDTGVSEYVYNKVALSDINKSITTFRAIPNVEKFEQMMEFGRGRYFLQYDISLNKLNPSNRDMGLDNTDAGPDSYLIFILDGQNKTLDAKNESWTTPLFDNVCGQIENLRLVNVNASGVATLASSLTGTLSNVTVVGNLTNTTTGATPVGGVVAEFTGTARSVEGLVNVKAKAGYVGGLFGKVNSGSTITYSTNGGQVISTAHTDLGTEENIPGFTTKSLETGVSEISAKFTAIAGGLVGYAPNGVSITSSYNANAVLAGYTIDDPANYVAGGIVGYSGSALTLEDCHNIGLVGAGNYTSTGFSYAGGLFGYAASISATSCMNDGQVEAINKVTANQDVKATIRTGTDYGRASQDWTNDPKNVVYDLTIKYNTGDARKIYAYGLGFAEGGSFENSKTSIDNIKNDGNIGQVSQETTLTIDRKGILNNDTDKHFYGKFGQGCSYKVGTDSHGNDVFKSVDLSKVYVNGYDAYGYPYRVYMIDAVQRSYGRNLSNNDIYQAYQDDASLTGASGKRLYYRYEGLYNGSSVNSYIYHKSEGEYYSNNAWHSGDAPYYAKDGAEYGPAEKNNWSVAVGELSEKTKVEKESGKYIIRTKEISNLYANVNDVFDKINLLTPGDIEALKEGNPLSSSLHLNANGGNIKCYKKEGDAYTPVGMLSDFRVGSGGSINVESFAEDAEGKPSWMEISFRGDVSVKAEDITGDKIDSDMSNFYLEGQVQPYASSKTFDGKKITIGNATYVGYEAFLHQKLVSNLVTDDSSYQYDEKNAKDIETETEKNVKIDTKIKAIDAKNDANNNATNYKVITINGNSSAIVYSGGQFTSVYMPVIMDATFTFSATNIQDDQTLSKSNFTISGDYVSGNKKYALQYYELTGKSQSGSNVTATFKLYFSKGVDVSSESPTPETTLTASLQYIKQMNDAFTLGNSNVVPYDVDESGIIKTYAGILVDDLTFGTGANAINLSDKGVIDSINEGTLVGSSDENFVYDFASFTFKNGETSTNESATGWTIDDEAYNGYLMIKTNILYDSFNYTQLTGVTLSVTQNINKASLTANVSTETYDSETVLIDSSFGAGVEKTFRLYTNNTNAVDIGNAAIKQTTPTYDIIVYDDGTNKSIQVDLNHDGIKGTNGESKIYFDNGKHYALMYDGAGNWYAYSDGTDEFYLTISDGTLTISAPNSIDDDELRRFVQKQGDVGNILGANVVSSIISGSVASESMQNQISNGTRTYGDFSVAFAASTFWIGNDYYNDSGSVKEAFISDVSTIDNNLKTDYTTHLFSGALGDFMFEHNVHFYVYNHTYIYKLNAGESYEDKFTYNGADTVYYELVYTPAGDSAYTKSGKISHGNTISLNTNFAANDTFVLKTYKTTITSDPKYSLSDSSATTKLNQEEIFEKVTDNSLITTLNGQTFTDDRITYGGNVYDREEKESGSGYDYYKLVGYAIKLQGATGIDYQVDKYTDGTNKIVTIGSIQGSEGDLNNDDYAEYVYSYEYTINNGGSSSLKYYKAEKLKQVTNTGIISHLNNWDDDLCEYNNKRYLRINIGTAESPSYKYCEVIEDPSPVEDLSVSSILLADVAVYDFDYHNIWFARNENNYQFKTTYSYTKSGSDTQDLTSISANMKENENWSGSSYDLFKGVESKEDVTTPTTNQDAFITYWLKDEDDQGYIQTSQSDESSGKYTVSRDTNFEGFGTWKYSYSYRAEVGKDSFTSDTLTEPEDAKYFTNIILADDIKLDKSLNTNEINIIGNSFVINYVVDSTTNYSLFGQNDSNILNTNFIGMTSLRGAQNASQYSLLTKTNGYVDTDVNPNKTYLGKIKDVNVYGVVRNVANVKNLQVYPFICTSIDGSTLSNAKSYITVNGLDANDNLKDVNTKIVDKVDASGLSFSNYQSFNILIAGNGKSKIGENVNIEEKILFITYKTTCGAKGGKGGSVNVSSKANVFNGTVRVGVAGSGSYGENGENGGDVFTRAGRNHGDNGADGLLNDAEGGLKIRTLSTQPNGNTGMAGYNKDLGTTTHNASGSGDYPDYEKNPDVQISLKKSAKKWGNNVNVYGKYYCFGTFVNTKPLIDKLPDGKQYLKPADANYYNPGGIVDILFLKTRRTDGEYTYGGGNYFENSKQIWGNGSNTWPVLVQNRTGYKQFSMEIIKELKDFLDYRLKQLGNNVCMKVEMVSYKDNYVSVDKFKITLWNADGKQNTSGSNTSNYYGYSTSNASPFTGTFN